MKKIRTYPRYSFLISQKIALIFFLQQQLVGQYLQLRNGRKEGTLFFAHVQQSHRNSLQQRSSLYNLRGFN